MKHFTRVLITIGMVLLGLGIVAFIRLVLTGTGTLLPSFLLCMASLLFFNLPAVIQRRLDRRRRSKD